MDQIHGGRKHAHPAPMTPRLVAEHKSYKGSPPHPTPHQQPCTHSLPARPQLYLAGLCDGFVSTLFSSFVNAVLQRSLLCCQAGRRHFNAYSSALGSNRDHPMTNATFLRALLHSAAGGM